MFLKMKSYGLYELPKPQILILEIDKKHVRCTFL